MGMTEQPPPASGTAVLTLNCCLLLENYIKMEVEGLG